MIVPIDHSSNWRLIHKRKQKKLIKILSKKIVRNIVITTKLMTACYLVITKKINMRPQIRDLTPLSKRGSMG